MINFSSKFGCRAQRLGIQLILTGLVFTSTSGKPGNCAPTYTVNPQAKVLIAPVVAARNAGDWQKVVEIATRSLGADSYYARARIYRADAYEQLGATDKAVSDYKFIIEQPNKNYPGFWNDYKTAEDRLKDIGPWPPPLVDWPASVPMAMEFEYINLKRQDPVPALTREISAMAWSPDGATIAAGSWKQETPTSAAIGDISVRDALTSKELLRLAGRWSAPYNGSGPKPDWIGHFSKVTALAYASDGKWLASSDGSGAVSVWELPRDRKSRFLATGPAGIEALSWPEGRLSAICSNGVLLQWNTGSGAAISAVKAEPRATQLTSPDSGSWIRRAAFSPDGKWLAAANSRGRIVLWDLADTAKYITISNSQDQDSARPEGVEVTALAFSPDNNFLASANYAHIYINKVERGEPFRPYAPRLLFAGERIGALQWSPNSLRLFARGSEKLFMLNPSPEPGTAVTAEYPVQKAFSPEMVLSPRQNILAEAGDDGSLFFWKETP